MYFWKLDEETIRCLVDRNEIDEMGFDIETISTQRQAMEEFIGIIVQNSRNYISWNTDNGIQMITARALSGDQFLFTISCTRREDVINQNLDQIRKMTDDILKSVSEERLDEITKLTGTEKEEAFEKLTRELYEICTGEAAGDTGDTKESDRYTAADDSSGRLKHNSDTEIRSESGPGEDSEVKTSTQIKKKDSPLSDILPDQKIVFDSLERLQIFCGLLHSGQMFDADLYKFREEYILLVHFQGVTDRGSALFFMLIASEFGGEGTVAEFDQAWLDEHATRMIQGTALMDLRSLT